MDTEKTIREQLPHLGGNYFWKLVQKYDRYYYLQIHEYRRMIGRQSTGGLVFSEPVMMQIRGNPVPWTVTDGFEPLIQLAQEMKKAVTLA